MHLPASHKSQSGVALAVALIMLVVLTLLALSGVRLSTMELRMAQSDEFRVAAFEQAQSVVDVAIRQFSNTPVLFPGTVICADISDCPLVQITLPSTYDSDLTNNYVNLTIRGIPPLSAEPPVGAGFSLTTFDASYLKVTGEWTRNDMGWGAAKISEGISVVYGSAGDTTTTQSQDEFGGA